MKPKILLTFIFLTIPALSWYFTDLSYRMPITIIERSGNTLTDFQVSINLTYNTHMQPDFSDIRFTWLNETNDIEEKVPYWIDIKENSSWAYVWVKIPKIPANNNTTVYVYYGNTTPVQSESNGTAVFEFFDDMENWSGWIIHDHDGDGLGRVIQDSARAYDGSYSAHKIEDNDPDGAYKPIGKTLHPPIILEAWVNRNSAYAGGKYDKIGLVNDSGYGYGSFCIPSEHSFGIDARKNWSVDSTSGATSTRTPPGTDVWYMQRLIIKTPNTVEVQILYPNRTLFGDFNGTLNPDFYYFENFTNVYIFGGYDYWVDQIKIRKYANPEPLFLVGSEEARVSPQASQARIVNTKAPINVPSVLLLFLLAFAFFWAKL